MPSFAASVPPPSAQPEPPLPDPAEERAWIDGELIRRAMEAARSGQYMGLVMIGVTMLIGCAHLPTWPLLGWAFGAVLLWTVRAWVFEVHRQAVAALDGQAQVRYMRRWAWMWPISGAWWSLVSGLFMRYAPVPEQFICWVLIAGTGVFCLNSYSNWWPAVRDFAGALVGTAMLMIVLRMLETGWNGMDHTAWMLLLGFVLWHLLWSGGRRLNRAFRASVEFHFRNKRLIESLTRQTQAALDAVAVKNRFLANATHDLRQPVHALSLYADWLREDPSLAVEIVPRIVESTRAVNALFDSLFDLARLDAGEFRLSLEPVSMDCLLREIELQYRPLAEAKGLRWRVHARPGEVRTDPIRLRRILGNLLSNAIKYTESGGVLLAVRPQRQGLRLEVWDTGVGIARQHLSDIFREFYKVPTHAGTADGFGLGLAIVARLAGTLGHAVTVRSRPGRGTVFTLELRDVEEAAVRRRVRAAMTQLASRP
jgi:signal transduction histidine kinase